MPRGTDVPTDPVSRMLKLELRIQSIKVTLYSLTRSGVELQILTNHEPKTADHQASSFLKSFVQSEHHRNLSTQGEDLIYFFILKAKRNFEMYALSRLRRK